MNLIRRVYLGVRRRTLRLVKGYGTGSVLENTPKPSSRGKPPAADDEDLRATYINSALDRAPNDFILYRIIGNDLPPRHMKGQSQRNLEFILDHEVELERCRKMWIVNRIVDREEEQAILDVLREREQTYIRIPFDLDEYVRCAWDVEGLPWPGFTFSEQFSALDVDAKGRAFYRLYRNKNNYVMHINGARNAALEDGRDNTKWILPWDGNCFIREDAWKELVREVDERPWYPYFIVPMARIIDNQLLLNSDYETKALEEPQIIFRKDSRLSFNENYFYGRRDKVELLWRLGVTGKWDNWRIEPWDLMYSDFAEEAGQYRCASWVARLDSGQREMEAHSTAALVQRGVARVDAVTGMLDDLDRRALERSFKRSNLTTYDRRLFGGDGDATDLGLLVGEKLSSVLLNAADAALMYGPYSVVDKTGIPPSGNKQDYYHPAPYFWPSPIFPKVLPYVGRDGKRVPGTRMYEPSSNQFDRTRVQRLFDDSTLCALAWALTKDPRYADHAARLLRTWFVDEETRMNPHLSYAQVRRGHDNNQGSPSGIIEMKDFYYYLDTVRILEGADVLTESVQSAFRDWLAEYYDWLNKSAQGRKEQTQPNNHGTYYDLQTASIAAFLGDTQELVRILRRSRERILQQFDASGFQAEEMKRTITAHYCAFNLQGWIHLATLADSFGENLWAYEGRDGRGIRKGLEWVLHHREPPWPYKQIETFDFDRFLPLQFTYLSIYGSFSILSHGDLPVLNDCKPQFHPHDGVRPYWMFGAEMPRLA